MKVLDFGLAKEMDPPSPEPTAGKAGYAMNSVGATGYLHYFASAGTATDATAVSGRDVRSRTAIAAAISAITALP